MVSTADFHASSGFDFRSRGLKETKNVSSPSTCENKLVLSDNN